MPEGCIYLDYNATTPVDPRVLQAMIPYLEGAYGNAASRTHAFGWEAEEAVARGRAAAAKLIGARPAEIVFTSGATESTNLALKGLAERRSGGRDHIVTVATEHKATLDTVAWLAKQGLRTTILTVDGDGLLDLEHLRDAVDERTLAVSVMLVNNEIGVIQPVAEIGALCRERGAVFHCDAAQAFGKIPVDVQAMGIDLMSVSAHKIYAPKGMGLLYVRSRDSRVNVAEHIHGGGHESGYRSGTLNVPGIVALGKSAEIARAEMAEEEERVAALARRLQEGLVEAAPGARLNGHPTQRLAGNVNLSFPGIQSEALLMALDKLAVSTGSACNSDRVEPSYVLKACGMSDDRALGAIRFGVGRFTTEEEVEQVIDWVGSAVRGMARR